MAAVMTRLPSVESDIRVIHQARGVSNILHLTLFIYWKFHGTDGQDSELFLGGQMNAHFFSHVSASAL